MVAPPDIDGLPPVDLKELPLKLPEGNAEQRRVIAELREEIARLKGLKGRPSIKQPSGIESLPVWSVMGCRIHRYRRPNEPLPHGKVPLGRQLRVIPSPQGLREYFRSPALFETGPLRRPRSA
jgi:hypothetical protein